MDDFETDYALRETERHLTLLSRRALPDPGHKALLRRELLRRHQELAARPRSPLLSWSRLSPLKRVSLTLPPLGAALIASIVLLVVPVLSGHQSLQSAEAQRLSPELMYNVPTITSWQWTIRETVGQRTRVLRYQAQLRPWQRVYVAHGQAYFYDNQSVQKWLQPAAHLTGLQTSPYDWQWAFGLLPQTLTTDDFTLLPAVMIGAQRAEGIKKTIAISGERAVTLTFWVHRRTGLVLRLEREVTAGNRELEHDVVDYRYRTTA